MLPVTCKQLQPWFCCLVNCMPNNNGIWLQKMKRGLMSDRACPFAFAVATFSMKVLIATLLFDDHYIPNPLSTVRAMVNVYKIFFFLFIPSYFTVFVMRGILCLSLSFPCFQDSISKVIHLYWSALLHEFLRSSPQMLVLAACNSSFCGKQKLLSRPSFCELDLHMKDEGAVLYYILQVSLALWKIFNPTINWASLLCLCPLFLNWK